MAPASAPRQPVLVAVEVEALAVARLVLEAAELLDKDMRVQAEMAALHTMVVAVVELALPVLAAQVPEQREHQAA
jgi:hypothetical protein